MDSRPPHMPFMPNGRPDLRTAQTDNAILDAMIAAVAQALAAGVEDGQVGPLDTMRHAMIGARRAVASGVRAGEREPTEAMAVVELVLAGVIARCWEAISRITADPAGQPPIESPLGMALSCYFTLHATARAYLVTTEGGH